MYFEMKVTKAQLLRELYDIEAEKKLLIGYRFKGCLPSVKRNGHSSGPKKTRRIKRRIAA